MLKFYQEMLITLGDSAFKLFAEKVNYSILLVIKN